MLQINLCSVYSNIIAQCVVPENIHTLPMEGIGISRGVGGGPKAQENPEGGGQFVSIILFFPDRFHYSYMLNFLCLHFAYRSADANIDLVHCTKVTFSRWSGSISGAARVWTFYQKVAD